MVRAACPAAAGPLEDYATCFDDLFSRLAQRCNGCNTSCPSPRGTVSRSTTAGWNYSSATGHRTARPRCAGHRRFRGPQGRHPHRARRVAVAEPLRQDRQRQRHRDHCVGRRTCPLPAARRAVYPGVAIPQETRRTPERRRPGRVLGQARRPGRLEPGTAPVPRRAHRDLVDHRRPTGLVGTRRAHPARGRHHRPADLARQGNWYLATQTARPGGLHDTPASSRNRPTSPRWSGCTGSGTGSSKITSMSETSSAGLASKPAPLPRSAATNPWSTARSRSAGTPGSTHHPHTTPRLAAPEPPTDDSGERGHLNRLAGCRLVRLAAQRRQERGQS